MCGRTEDWHYDADPVRERTKVLRRMQALPARFSQGLFLCNAYTRTLSTQLPDNRSRLFGLP